MAGHSKWKQIKHKKAAQDAKRGAKFTKLIKEITIAARQGGGDHEGNARLRTAIENAKAGNMPADNITRAVKKGTGELEGVLYEEATYEGYGPGGAAILINVTSDNLNRTVASIRHIFTKNGGNLGTPNSVAWMFTSKGQLYLDATRYEEDDVFEGWEGDLVIYDEPPRRNVRIANARGLIDRNGKELFCMTLLKEAWVDREVIKARNDDGSPDLSVFNVNADIYSNVGFGITQNGVKEFIKKLFLLMSV